MLNLRMLSTCVNLDHIKMREVLIMVLPKIIYLRDSVDFFLYESIYKEHD